MINRTGVMVLAPDIQAQTTAPTRRSKRPGIAAQRETILRATLDVLATRTLEATRVEDILLAADVSRQTFYRAFKNLDELFTALIKRVDDFLRVSLTTHLHEATTPAAWIEAYIAAVFDAALAVGPALAAIAREEKRPGSPFYGTIAARQTRLAQQIAAWFDSTYGLVADPWQIQAVLIVSHEFCVRLADPTRRGATDIAQAKAALLALAEGLILRAGATAAAWRIAPATAAGARLLAHLPRLSQAIATAPKEDQ